MAGLKWNFVLSENELEGIAKEACEGALTAASAYEHKNVAEWNGQIITRTLTSLTNSIPDPTRYKFSINSTTIQHDSHSAGQGEDFAQNAKRGMHSASGAFWDAGTDGMWSYKYNGEGKRGFDVVLSVLWIGLPE